MRHVVIVPDYLQKQKKAAGAAVQAAGALCPAPAGSASYSVVAMLSDWMMVMTNGNGDDDNVGKWQW